MITVKLKDAMEAYRRRTGERMTYAKLSQLTDISQSTLRKIGSVLSYHPTLSNIERICVALDATPGDMLEIIPDPPKAKPKPKPKRQTKSPKAAKRR
ncbi:MAG: helix-turn-helix transcriptional regulator [Phycisphaerae bacterium]